MIRKKILIVDDSSSIRELLKLTLSKENYEILVGVDGRDALKFLDGQHIDLVITDLHMPNMNGLELIREIRNKV